MDGIRRLDDLGWLDEAVGDARVVAIGESAHYNAESYRLRHRVLQRLVEEHGFRTYAMETGFVESRVTDDWIRGGAERELGDVLASGITSLMGLWLEMREQLAWLREHNRTAAEPVWFTGIDLPGSNASLLPGLDATLAYLAEADPELTVDPSLRETAAAVAAPSAFSALTALGALAELPPAARDALTAGLAELRDRLVGRRLGYQQVTGAAAYDRALHSVRLTVALDQVARAMLRGDRASVMFTREAAIAGTVEWILERSRGRVVLAAHNGHIQRWPGTLPGLAPVAPMGLHLADRLGDDYLVIGTTTGRGQTLNTAPDFYTGKLFTELEPPRAGSIDAVLDAAADGPFAVDLRRHPALLKGVTEQRFGAYYAPIDAAQAYDVLVHLPEVTAATPDPEAVAASPAEVQKAFG